MLSMPRQAPEKQAQVQQRISVRSDIFQKHEKPVLVSKQGQACNGAELVATASQSKHFAHMIDFKSCNGQPCYQ